MIETKLTANPFKLNTFKPLPFFSKAIPAVVVLGVMAAGWILVHRINTGSDLAEDIQAVSSDEPAIADMLTLPDGKLQAGGFASIPVEPQLVQHLHTVPGRIRYDESKHVDVKAPMDGILAEVLVTPGQDVDSGQLLAVLRSPEIGQARADILKRQKEREIAQQMLDREITLSKNLERLSSMLQQRRSIETIERCVRQSIAWHLSTGIVGGLCESAAFD